MISGDTSLLLKLFLFNINLFIFFLIHSSIKLFISFDVLFKNQLSLQISHNHFSLFCLFIYFFQEFINFSIYSDVHLHGNLSLNLLLKLFISINKPGTII